MKRSLASMAVLALIACGSANEEPAPVPAPAPTPQARAEAAKPQAPAEAANAPKSQEDLWIWAGDGEPGDLAANVKTCEDAAMTDPRGGPNSPALVQLQIGVTCMVEKGWKPRLGM